MTSRRSGSAWRNGWPGWMQSERSSSSSLPSLKRLSGSYPAWRRQKPPHAAECVLELRKQQKRRQNPRGVVGPVAAGARPRQNQRYRWAMPHCAPSRRWAARSRQNRSVSTWARNSACRSGRTISVWPCSVTAAAVGSASTTRAGRCRRGRHRATFLEVRWHRLRPMFSDRTRGAKVLLAPRAPDPAAAFRMGEFALRFHPVVPISRVVSDLPARGMGASRRHPAVPGIRRNSIRPRDRSARFGPPAPPTGQSGPDRHRAEDNRYEPSVVPLQCRPPTLLRSLMRVPQMGSSYSLQMLV
jgi:hypothetical protein